jgi:hypothetical protein
MIKTTSGSYILPGRNSQSFQAKHAPAPKNLTPARPRLEELINQLVELDSKPKNNEMKSTGSVQKPTVPAALPKSPQVKEFTTQTKKALPAEIRKELNLPGSSEGAYNHLLNFYEANRHKPLIETANGRIIYLEFDLQMQRIRLFAGQQSQKTCMFRNRVESAGYFVIEEVYELRVESQAREVFGFKRTENKVVERFKSGIELLSSIEAADKSIQPVLFFTVFDEKLSGMANSCVKAEKVTK